jgi:hypothetical protein
MCSSMMLVLSRRVDLLPFRRLAGTVSGDSDWGLCGREDRVSRRGHGSRLRSRAVAEKTVNQRPWVQIVCLDTYAFASSIFLQTIKRIRFAIRMLRKPDVLRYTINEPYHRVLPSFRKYIPHIHALRAGQCSTYQSPT